MVHAVQENYPLPTSLRVGDWVIDPATGLMSREGHLDRLDARTLRLLLCMSRFPGTVFAIEDLLKQVWPGIDTGEDTVHKAVATMRKQLRDDPREPSYIVAFPGIGYKLIAKIEVSSQTSAAAEVDSVAAFGPAPAQPAASTDGAEAIRPAPASAPAAPAKPPVAAPETPTPAPEALAEPAPAAPTTPVAPPAEINPQNPAPMQPQEAAAPRSPAEQARPHAPEAEDVLAPDLILKPSVARRPESLAEPESVVDLDFAIDLDVLPQSAPTLLTQAEEPEATCEPDAVPGPPMALDMLTMPDQFDIPEHVEAPKKSVTQATDATPFPQLGAARETTPPAQGAAAGAVPTQDVIVPAPEAPPIPRAAKRSAQTPEATPFPRIKPPTASAPAPKADPVPPAMPDATAIQPEKPDAPAAVAAPAAPAASAPPTPAAPMAPVPAAPVPLPPPASAPAADNVMAPAPTAPPAVPAPSAPGAAAAPSAAMAAAKSTPAPTADTAEPFTPAAKRGIHASWWGILVCVLITAACIAGMLVRPPPETPRTVGVLPFIDLTDALARDPGAAAMTEQVIGRLAAVPGIIVSPPAVSLSYRDRPVSIGEFATAAQVAYVLDGSLRKTDSAVRIAVRLSRASDGAVVWKQTYERAWNERPAIQDEIAIEVGNALAKPTP